MPALLTEIKRIADFAAGITCNSGDLGRCSTDDMSRVCCSRQRLGTTRTDSCGAGQELARTQCFYQVR